MMNTFKSLQTRGLHARFASVTSRLLAMLTLLVSSAVAQETTFPLLKTKTGEYTNVTVTAKSATEVYISHAGGVQNLKIHELEEETLEQLGYVKPRDRKKEAEEAFSSGMEKLAESLPIKSAEGQQIQQITWADIQSQIPAHILWGVIGGIVLGFLFYCYCLRLICVKAGHPPGALVWLPLLQTFPMLRAAGMSGWWFLAFFVPVLNLIASILWCVKITEARGKSGWVALFLVLPVTNLFAFFYLAFSGGGKAAETKGNQPPALPSSGKFVVGARA